MAEITRNGATIHYTDTGIPRDRPGAATVFFGHGLLFGGWMFGPQIGSLKNDYRCVAIDWRGQGASSAPADGYDMDTLADDAMTLIGELGVGPVHYVGLSMGGFIGQRIAARHPELVRSLTLLDTSAGPEDPDKLRRYKLMGAAYRLVGIGPLRKAVLPLMFGPDFLADPVSAPLLQDWEQRLRDCRRAGIARAVKGVADRASVESEIGSITIPTLVIVGDDDVATPPAKARRIAELIPGARLEQVSHCGHSATVEQPETVTGLIREFLDTTARR